MSAAPKAGRGKGSHGRECVRNSPELFGRRFPVTASGIVPGGAGERRERCGVLGPGRIRARRHFVPSRADVQIWVTEDGLVQTTLSPAPFNLTPGSGTAQLRFSPAACCLATAHAVAGTFTNKANPTENEH